MIQVQHVLQHDTFRFDRCLCYFPWLNNRKRRSCTQHLAYLCLELICPPPPSFVTYGSCDSVYLVLLSYASLPPSKMILKKKVPDENAAPPPVGVRSARPTWPPGAESPTPSDAAAAAADAHERRRMEKRHFQIQPTSTVLGKVIAHEAEAEGDAGEVRKGARLSSIYMCIGSLSLRCPRMGTSFGRTVVERCRWPTSQRRLLPKK